MTTVVDPLGTPSIVYNRSGRNIQAVTAGADNTFANAVAISHVSETTIVVITVDGSGSLSLSSDFEQGDIVFVAGQGSISNIKVYGSDGTLVSGGTIGEVDSNFFGQFVKTGTGAHDWVRVG